MPSRINHIKLVTPNPGVVNAFLTQVCDIPEGWPLGENDRVVGPDEPLGPGGDMAMEAILEVRNVTGPGGYIAGDPVSRQFQIFKGEPADFWGICISTRHIEDLHQKAKARDIACTPITIADWNERDNIANFFCVVDGLTFEIIRVEPKTG
jgi:hypothetical protein